MDTTGTQKSHALWRADELKGYTIMTTDGEVGHIDDLFFDDGTWGIRYLVVGTGGWYAHGRLLLHPWVIVDRDARKRHLTVSISREALLLSPRVDAHKPVSWKSEEELAHHFSWPLPPWLSNVLFETPRRDSAGDPHLRSAQEVIESRVHAADGDIGHVADMVVEEGAWVVRYLIVDTRKWLPGRRVLIAPQWIEAIDWEDKKVSVGLSRDEVNSSPEYRPSSPLKREDEIRLYDYYRRPPYWADR